jgi:hypothetical protein
MEAAEPIAAPGTTHWRERARDPVLTALALLLASLSFITAPLLTAGVIAAYALNLAAWVLIIVAIAVLVRPAVAVVVVVLAVAFAAVDAERVFGTPDDRMTYASLALGCVFLVVLITAVGRAVFASGRVTYHRILGAIVLYMAVAYLFAIAYHLIKILAPGAFAGIDAPPNSLRLITELTYFSYVTLTSTGYGDITPVHPIARSLANLEAMIGQLYPATLLARMVTLYDATKPR